MRGGRDPNTQPDDINRSIPAYAGGTWIFIEWLILLPVDPRVCGGDACSEEAVVFG